MKNKHWILLLVTIFSSVSYISCTKDTATAYLGNWKGSLEPPFKGGIRAQAVSFVIGTEGYVGGGRNPHGDQTDFWEFHSTANHGQGYWSQIASFPGPARSDAVGFSIDSVGYVGTGVDIDGNYYNDFYAYNPQTDTWTRKHDFPLTSNSTGRSGAIGFAINGYGYVGCGFDGYNYDVDFYKYDPTADSWSPEYQYSGQARQDGGVFIIGDKAYICTGYNGSGNGAYGYANDLVIFNSTDDTWVIDPRKLNNNDPNHTFDDTYTDICRQEGAVFSMNGKGYVTLGSAFGSIPNGRNTWEYDPVTDLWTRKQPFEGTQRVSPICLQINNRVFIGTGYLGSGNDNTDYYNDMWEFNPQGVFVQND